jgi:hypothetical protein
VPIRIRHKVLFGELTVSYEATIVGPTTPMRRFAIKRSSRSNQRLRYRRSENHERPDTWLR